MDIQPGVSPQVFRFHPGSFQLRGQVVATDINMRFLERMKRPNLKLLRHDLTTEPLPEGEFDLVHAPLDDPDFLIPSPTMWAIQGQRPFT